MTIDEYAESFGEEPGYLDFARVGPVGRAVKDEQYVLTGLLGRARFGTVEALVDQDIRVREAVASLTGFPADRIEFQPNTSTGLMHVMFGLTGGVAMSRAEYPSMTVAAMRAAETLGPLTPVWLETDHGRVTPGNLRDQLTSAIEAVAVSLVDFRTGYLADLEGIRQVIGDRLLIVDAVQGFGVVDAPYTLADVVVAGGQKWTRAGWGTGFLALSERALERLSPVFSGFGGDEWEVTDDSPPRAPGAAAFRASSHDPIAQARFAVALEEIISVGVPEIAARLAEKVNRVIDLADQHAVPVSSPRDESERAGIVVLEPPADRLTALTASLFNHGLAVTLRGGRVRVSPHISTGEDTFEMLKAGLISFAAVVSA